MQLYFLIICNNKVLNVFKNVLKLLHFFGDNQVGIQYIFLHQFDKLIILLEVGISKKLTTFCNFITKKSNTILII